MSNVLKVSQQNTIQNLIAKGWSQRRIARELGLNRRTVARYADSKCATEVTPGSDGTDSKCTTEVTPGSAAAGEPEKSRGERSACAGFSNIILKKMEAGLSAQRIYQDLCTESEFSASYQSVKRYVARQKAAAPQRFERIETEPGEEVQVDFGLGAMIDQPGGKAKRSWVLRMVLSHSRKGYSEAGSSPASEHRKLPARHRERLSQLRRRPPDPQPRQPQSRRAASRLARILVSISMADFCRFYGISVMPCQPGIPRHKGKVERGVDYVRNNALKGRRFPSLQAENDHLQQWESHTADKRIHGTTRRQVAALFEEERPHLQPLPAGLFPSYQEARRTAGRDSYIEVARAYYEVPPEYIGNQVWARWDSRTVRVLQVRGHIGRRQKLNTFEEHHINEFGSQILFIQFVMTLRHSVDGLAVSPLIPDEQFATAGVVAGDEHHVL